MSTVDLSHRPRCGGPALEETWFRVDAELDSRRAFGIRVCCRATSASTLRGANVTALNASAPYPVEAAGVASSSTLMTLSCSTSTSDLNGRITGSRGSLAEGPAFALEQAGAVHGVHVARGLS